MSDKILIIGKGFLGGTIFSTCQNAGIHVLGTHYNKSTPIIDITNIHSIEKVVNQFRPDLIINCAALTNLDQIESNPERAYAINAQGTKNIAEVSRQNKIKMIHISTDSVFDGKKGMYSEDDIRNPINEYAKSKKMGEDFVKEKLDTYIIIRTNFYGYNSEGKFLFNWILKKIKEKQEITGFSDIIFNPLEIRNLSDMIKELAYKDFNGVIHLSSNEIFSKYEFIIKIAKMLNFDMRSIIKGSIKNANFTSTRPLNTSLSNQLAKKILKTQPLSLKNWLENFDITNSR
jgi:dTDP-4-dehydrorhamnose reductase|tara:strand:+ start:2979 stop:3842 length:864 start_codon:yes stop_codon:yes gene_type:complete